MSDLATPGQITTFYSYKGGTGRTMALANTAALLALQDPKGRGVVAVDWDLEAPGLHRYFAQRILAHDARDFDDRPGLIDWFLAAREAVGAASRSPTAPVPDPADEPSRVPDLDPYLIRCAFGPLWIMKAGRLDEGYAGRVRSFNWKEAYEDSPEVLDEFRKALTRRFDHVLIDSRTGISDVSGICTALLPERLVVVFTPNSQSLLGGIQAARSAVEHRRTSDDLRPLRIVPLPSRVDDAEKDLQRQWRYGEPRQGVSGYQPEFVRLFQEAYDLDTCDLSAYFDEVQIQHVPRYAYGEQVAVLQERVGERLSQARSYQTFVAHLLDERPPWEPAGTPQTMPGLAAPESVREAILPAARDALPYPVALLLRKSKNARTEVDRHEAAYAAWEVSVRLALAGRPPLETQSLVRGTIGNWVQSLETDDQPIAVEEIGRVYGLLREGAGEKAIPEEATARRLVDALPAYRDRVLAQGAVRSEEYYRGAAQTLVEGLQRAWESGVFWPPGSHLLYVGEVEQASPRRAILLDGELPAVQDASRVAPGLPPTPSLCCLREGDSQPLEPWAVFEDDPTTPVVWFLTVVEPSPVYVNPATGERRPLAGMQPIRPTLAAEVHSTFSPAAARTDIALGAEDTSRAPLRLGRYQVERALGSGAVGTVYLGRDLSLRRTVAIKVLRDRLDDGSANQTRRQRFQREIEALSRVQSPYVVRILDVGTEDGHPFLTMEYVEGVTARDYLERARPGMTPKDIEREAARIVRDAARGVHDLHVQGVLHRDLKPSNIMVSRDGRRVVVMDLGLASVAEAAVEATGTGEIIGTPRYMAPERFGSGQDVGPRTDVYALGASLFELVTGSPLYDAEDMQRLIFMIMSGASPRVESSRSSVSPELLRIIQRSTERDPTRRYDSAEALADDLDAFLAVDTDATVLHPPLIASTKGRQANVVAAAGSSPSGIRRTWVRALLWTLAVIAVAWIAKALLAP